MIFDVLWRRPLLQRPAPTATASTPDGVFVHERSTRLVCLDPADGVARWDVPVGTWPRAVVADGRQCWVISQDRNELRCLDVRSGEVHWSVDLPRFTAHIVVAGDRVLVGGWRGYTALRAFDRWTGALLWAERHRAATVLPAAVGERVLVGEPGGSSVRLLDVRDGTEVCRWSLPEPLVGGDGQWQAFVAAGPDRFLLRCGARTLWQVNPGAGTAGEFFRHDRDLAATGISTVGAVVWARERHRGAVALDLTTREFRGRVSVGPDVVGQVVPAAAGHVLATGRPGMLLLVDDAGRPRERRLVDQQIGGLRPLMPGVLLVAGKGTLLAVDAATPTA
ncbi:PQQ-binding-like beta-propeller repeat protein [Micromonospora sp. NPDC049175]|uniref:outer membrane protein assembly factor BamB family protein n=1 Tax=Micromonospora sp. NPDC049175 TaxID=3364266 RepID=UPI00371687BC